MLSRDETNPNVFVYGLVLTILKGITEQPNHTKNLDQKGVLILLSEDAMTELELSALAGLRPIFVHQRMDFLLLCMNQLINMALR